MQLVAREAIDENLTIFSFYRVVVGRSQHFHEQYKSTPKERT